MNPEKQIEFLRRLQELLSEGGFTATYKFALLQALADLSVEKGDAPDGSLRIAIGEIAEKFIEYYWNQARPFGPDVLRQNTKGQAVIVSEILELRAQRDAGLAQVRRDHQIWKRLRNRTANTIIKMPLWRLQTIGNGTQEFLYRQDEYANRKIRLLPAVPQAFRSFHGIVTTMIRGAWIEQIQRIGSNREILGAQSELEQFLFGTDRQSLAGFRDVLREHQHGACFYCGRKVRGSGELDHFVPWRRYALDLGHNFVFSDGKCNNAKRDHLAGIEHLDRWWQQNLAAPENLAEGFRSLGLNHDSERTLTVARWAYAQGQAARAQLWLRPKTFEPCDYRWRTILDQPSHGLSIAAEAPADYN